MENHQTKFFIEIQCKRAYQRVMGDAQSGRESSKDDLMLASIYEQTLNDNNLYEEHSDILTQIFDYNNTQNFDINDYNQLYNNGPKDLNNDGQISNEERNVFLQVLNILRNYLPQSRIAIGDDDNRYDGVEEPEQIFHTEDIQNDYDNPNPGKAPIIQEQITEYSIESNNDDISPKETKTEELRILGNQNNSHIEDIPNDIFQKQSLAEYPIRDNISQKEPQIEGEENADKYANVPADENELFREKIDALFDKDKIASEIEKIINNNGNEEENTIGEKESYDNSEFEGMAKKETNDPMKEMVDNIQNLSDEELLIYMHNWLSAGEFLNSDDAKHARRMIKALQAEGLSRDANFFQNIESNINDCIENLYEKIGKLQKQEKAEKCAEENDAMTVDEADIKEKEDDSNKKALASHISTLLGLQKNEKIMNIEECTNGDFIFDLKKGGKNVRGNFSKIEDGCEKIYLYNRPDKNTTLIFYENGKLKEKTIKNGNETINEEFLENGVYVKTVTENLKDGNTKITKEIKFLDGTIMKSEKILYPEYTDTDKKTDFTFSKDKVKGSYISVNQNDEKTGESVVEITHETKPAVKKDTKTVKTTSKSNTKKSKL